MTNAEFLFLISKDKDIYEHAKKLVSMYDIAKRIKIECHYFGEHHKHEYHDYGHPCPIVDIFKTTLNDLERE